MTYLDVRADLCATLERDGITIEGRPHAPCARRPIPPRFSKSDVIFVFVKAYDTLRALRPLGGRLDPATTIVSLQNGLGNEEAIKAALGGFVALVVGQRLRCRSLKAMASQSASGRAAPLSAVRAHHRRQSNRPAALIASAGLDVRVAYDIRSHLWGKLIANAAINPLSALLDCPSGTILEDADASSLARAVALESAASRKPRASSCRLPMRGCTCVRSSHRPPACAAPWRSILAEGKRTEIDQISGAIVAAGRRTQTSTPYNETMLRLIKARERTNSLAGAAAPA